MEPALKLALVSSGLFFLTGLLTGAWKYAHIARGRRGLRLHRRFSGAMKGMFA